MSNVGTKFVFSEKFIFDPNNNSLTDQSNENEVIRLGSNESRILMMFSERPSEVISRDQLHEFVWRDQGFQVDDSSLTQAISTLRKNLNDSTKAPLFIKTVPKKGYQFIASVERTTMLTNSSKLDQEPEHYDPTPLTSDAIAAPGLTGEAPVENNSQQPTAPEKKASARKFDIQPKFILFLAFLLPFVTLAMINPAPSKFRLIDTIDGIPLKTTQGHPPMDSWKPFIRACYLSYASRFPDKEKPVEIIATAGAQRNLILNYIHPAEYSFKNITVHLFANQTDLSELCKLGATNENK
ncbi:transcriptional regulator [Vibrio albus]|uniref:Transcriptional regulator n=1 Tax=Vibrio albus TaxID=2200953 RepID=A0A2U3BCD0_9VIBR|nr:transcriptional regulator [Vibrio albus]PWI34405.1 transcriptional regulator [Vibrio albus]